MIFLNNSSQMISVVRKENDMKIWSPIDVLSNFLSRFPLKKIDMKVKDSGRIEFVVFDFNFYMSEEFNSFVDIVSEKMESKIYLKLDFLYEDGCNSMVDKAYKQSVMLTVNAVLPYADSSECHGSSSRNDKYDFDYISDDAYCLAA